MAGCSPAPRKLPVQYLFALLVRCLFNISGLLCPVRARLAHGLALCGGSLFRLLDKRFPSFQSGPLIRESDILLSNGGARRVGVGDGRVARLLCTFAGTLESGDIRPKAPSGARASNCRGRPCLVCCFCCAVSARHAAVRLNFDDVMEQEGVKELAVHAEPRPNDILAYFLVGVTKDMRLKGFSELAGTTRAACTMLPRKTSVGGVRVFVWKQLTTRCKYVRYKEHTPTPRKRPRAEPAPAEAKRRRPLAA